MLVYKPTKRVAPAWLGYFAAVTVIAIFVFMIMFFINRQIWEVSVAGVLLIFDMILSHSFCWCKETRLELKNDKLLYHYDDVVTSLSGNTTTYTIKEIAKLHKAKNGKLEISGDILIKEPMAKTKNLKRFVIQYYTEEMLTVIENFKNKE
jgi:hypothetical protein